MTDHIAYLATAPTQAEIGALQGPTLLDFGTNWCGHCRAAKAAVDEALLAYPGVRHLKLEDGSGRPLGRFFRVKLWPTLIFLRDGVEVDRLVRPGDATVVKAALARIDPTMKP